MVSLFSAVPMAVLLKTMRNVAPAADMPEDQRNLQSIDCIFVIHAANASASCAEIPQHKAGAARLADAVAETVGLGPRVGADAHLVEGCRPPAAQPRAEKARVLVADDAGELLHGAGIHRE